MSSSPNILVRILGSKPVLIAELVIILFFAFNLGKEILKKQAIEREIKSLEAEIGKLESEHDDLGELLSYIDTDSFVRQEARDKFNLVNQGENLIVIPDVDATTSEAVLGAREFKETSQSEGEPTNIKKSNIVKWWQYFFDHDRLWLD